MNPTLTKIKRLINQGRYVFTTKADSERIADGLTQEAVLEAILNAAFLRVKNLTSPWRKGYREKMYIIESFTYNGILVYSKGVLRKHDNQETYYILVSAKRSTFGD